VRSKNISGTNSKKGKILGYRIITLLIALAACIFAYLAWEQAKKSARAPYLKIISFEPKSEIIDPIYSKIFKPIRDVEPPEIITNYILNLLTIKNKGKESANLPFEIRLDVKFPVRVFSIGICELSREEWDLKSELSDDTQIIEVKILDALLPEKELSIPILYYLENEEEIRDYVKNEEKIRAKEILQKHFIVMTSCPQCTDHFEDKWPKSPDKK